MSDKLEYRKELARQLLSSGIAEIDLENYPSPALLAAAAAEPKLDIPFPAGLAPAPQPIDPRPDIDAALPKADVLVITWTVDEANALRDVLTPAIPRGGWYRYARNFAQYVPKIRKGAPSLTVSRLASYFPTRIGKLNVLCLKSELHLNQDGIQTPPYTPGNASLPVKDLFHQLIDEVQPQLVITTGTAGGVYSEHDLGDVVVTRAAQFRVNQEFRNAPFAGKKYTSDWKVGTKYFAAAEVLMRRFMKELEEPEFQPPTINFAPLDHLPKPTRKNEPSIELDGDGLPAFHPILTTDFFEFGTSKNRLDKLGCAVEMGDAVLGLAVEERRVAGKSTPDWLVIRNCSDPQINGALRDDPPQQSLQAMWAVYYYKGFGYWTSVNSALATWAVIAGL